MTIAKALVNNPAIIFADEPTGDLDSETAQEIVNLIIVTHSMEVGDQAHRIVRMRDGLIADKD